jgi:ubiquinone/menaquinone biosynthesis C-methylase UbiE
MKALEKNKGHISGDPFKNSPYFAAAENDMKKHWDYYIWPRIKELDKSVVLDLACGHGRNTALLAPLSGKVIAADINTECIEACKERFNQDNSIEYLILDGSSLSQIPGETISLVYSWDSMVHFEPEVVEQYVEEFARVLQPGGYGFVHHSNRANPNMEDFRHEPHWRNFMSKDIFLYFLRKNKLIAVEQTIIGWDESILAEKPFWNKKDKNYIANLDCISTFKKRSR